MLGDVLRGLGSALNPQVNAQTDLEYENRLKQQQAGQQFMLAQLVKGVESGAIDPAKLPPGLQGLIGPSIEAQQHAGALKKSREWAAATAGIDANTPEGMAKLTALAVQNSDPKGLLGHADTLTRINATREATLSRLQQQASQFDMNYQMKKGELDRKGANAADHLALDTWYKNGRMALANEAARVAGATATYNVGAPSSSVQVAPFAPAAAGPQAASPTAPRPAPMTPPPSGPPAEGSFQAAQLADSFNRQNPGANMEAPMTADFLARTAPPQQTVLPNNMDARDLSLAGMYKGAVAPAAAAPVAAPPKQLTIADAPVDMTRREKGSWLLQQTRPSVAGLAELSPAAMKGIAEQVLAGDNTAAQGYARNVATKVAITNAVWEEAAKRGMNGDAVAARVAEFQGLKAGERAVGTRGAQIQMAATEAKEMGDLVRETSAKFARTNFVPWNMALKAYDTNTGATEIRDFGAALNSYVNVYARAINPTGVPHQADKEHARDILRTVDSPAAVVSVLKILDRELEIAKSAPRRTREAMRTEITGGGGAPDIQNLVDKYRTK